MNTENRVHQMKTIQAEALELFKKKNVDSMILIFNA